MSDQHGFTDSGAPPAPTNYSSISAPLGHPQGQNGNRNGYAVSESSDEPNPWIRFFKALGGAVLVALLAGLLFESMYLATERRAWEKAHLPEGYDVPSGLTVHQCASGSAWSDTTPPDDIQNSKLDSAQFPEFPERVPFPSIMYPFAANTSFNVPLGTGKEDDDTFFTLISRGRWLSGDVSFQVCPRQERGKARVEVVVKHLREDTRDQVRACLVEREDGGKGVGIFTPGHEWHWQGDSRRRRVHYEVNVILPVDYDQKVLVKRLEADLPNTSQSFRHSAYSFNFDEVVLKGSNSYIYAVPGLIAKRVVINATDTSVAGTFTVTEHLGIQTSGGSVTVRVWAKHIQGLNQGPSIDLQASNGSVESQIRLIPYLWPLPVPLPPSPPHIPEYGVPPHYDIRARTSDGQLSLEVFSEFEKDVNPTIYLNGTNTHGAAIATVYHTYSGAYDLQTHLQGAAQLQLRCPRALPMGCSDGYTRDHSETRSQGHLKGEVEWVPGVLTLMPGEDGEEGKGDKKKKAKSSIVLNAWNGPAVLTV